MAIESVDFTIKSGDGIDVDFTVYDEDNVLIDLSTSTIEYAARQYGGVTGASVLSYSTADHIAIISAGLCTVSIQPADTSSLYGKFQHALRVTTASGYVYTPYPNYSTVNKCGVFIVNKSIFA